MSPEVQAFAAGFPTTLAHAGASLALLAAGAAAYGATSHDQIRKVREGDAAAALLFGGAILALALPLAFSLNASTSLIEVALWGAAVVVTQLLAMRLVDLLLRGLPQRAREGEVTAAALLAATRLASAVILAAAVAG